MTRLSYYQRSDAKKTSQTQKHSCVMLNFKGIEKHTNFKRLEKLKKIVRLAWTIKYNFLSIHIRATVILCLLFVFGSKFLSIKSSCYVTSFIHSYKQADKSPWNPVRFRSSNWVNNQLLRWSCRSREISNWAAPLLKFASFIESVRVWLRDSSIESVRVWLCDSSIESVCVWLSHSFIESVRVWLSESFIESLRVWLCDSFIESVRVWLRDSLCQSIITVLTCLCFL